MVTKPNARSSILNAVGHSVRLIQVLHCMKSLHVQAMSFFGLFTNSAANRWTTIFTHVFLKRPFSASSLPQKSKANRFHKRLSCYSTWACFLWRLNCVVKKIVSWIFLKRLKSVALAVFRHTHQLKRSSIKTIKTSVSNYKILERLAHFTLSKR